MSLYTISEIFHLYLKVENCSGQRGKERPSNFTLSVSSPSPPDRLISCPARFEVLLLVTRPTQGGETKRLVST